MSSIWLTTDPHLFHENIWKQRLTVDSSEENIELFLKDYNDNVKKDDTVIFLGDVAFKEQGLEILKPLLGKKILVKGNHDVFTLDCYTDVFEDIHGLLFKHGFIYSHCPIHPDHLRHERKNIHGHLHDDVVRVTPNILQRLFKIKSQVDDRYFNICPENLNRLGLGTDNGYLISLTELRTHIQLEHFKKYDKNI